MKDLYAFLIGCIGSFNAHRSQQMSFMEGGVGIFSFADLANVWFGFSVFALLENCGFSVLGSSTVCGFS